MKNEIKVLLLAASAALLAGCVEDDAFNSGYSTHSSSTYSSSAHGYQAGQGNASHVNGTYSSGSSDSYTPSSVPRKKNIQATAPSANGFQSSSGVAPESAPATATGYQTGGTDASHAPVENAPVSGYSAQ